MTKSHICAYTEGGGTRGLPSRSLVTIFTALHTSDSLSATSSTNVRSCASFQDSKLPNWLEGDVGFRYDEEESLTPLEFQGISDLGAARVGY